MKLVRALSIALALLMGLGTAAHAADNGTQPTNVEFLIDISGSMAGAKIAGVKSAVKQLISGMPEGISVQVVVFNDSVKEIVPPTTDKEFAISKIELISAGRGTAIYDALDQSVKTATPGTHIILLSDGEDTNSLKSLSSLVGTLTSNTVQVDSIGLQTSGNQATILTKISDSTSGDFYSLDKVGLLLATYKKAIDKIIVTPKPTVSASPTKEAKPSTEAQIIREAYVQWTLYVLTLAVGILIFVLLMLARRAWYQRHLRVTRITTIAKYDVRVNLNPFTNGFDASFLKRYIPARLNKYVAEQLDSIHTKITSEQVFAVFPFAWLFVAFSLNLIFHNPIANGLFATILTPLIFDQTWKAVHKKQKKDFEGELPELLNMLASALRAGLSLQQGLEAYATENTGELARQIRRAIAEIHVGTPIDEALMKVATRMNNDDLKWTVTALSIQKTVGGSMATIITSVYETISGRAEIRREVRTLSAEGKLSAYVLIGLPIGLFLYLIATKPDYASLLWTHPIGIMILIYIVVSIVVGWLWMKKIVNIKV